MRRIYLIRILLILILLIPLLADGAPHAQYKTNTQKKWSSLKTTAKTGKVAAPKKINAPAPSSPKYRLALPSQALELNFSGPGRAVLNHIPRFALPLKDKVVGVTNRNEFIYYSLDPKMQTLTQGLIDKARAPHIAIVVMQPSTGRVLAIAGKSHTYDDLPLHAGFPAASLFKVITASAAVEKAAINPMHMVNFRGGIYTLNELNYRPDARRDQHSMTVAEALGRSCNPVFGRLGLDYLDALTVRKYARSFGFNEPIPFEAPLPESTASIPETDYEFSRTCAGFGAVTLSPVHAAMIMSALANGGLMPAPSFIERVMSADGRVVYESHPTLFKKAVSMESAATTLEMMEYTTTVGTSKREFAGNQASRLRGVRVAAKTGTLHGEDPVGLNHWFIAAAPIEKPVIAVAIISVNSSTLDSKPSHLGRLLIEKYLLG